MTDGTVKTANDMASERTDLAIERTVMGANRTLMAWVRTSLSMISFGFTIYKILQTAVKAGEVGLMKPEGPRRFGLFLIALGVLSAIFGSIEYCQTVRQLNKQSVKHYRAFNFSFQMGLMIGLLGLFLFLSILFHAEVF
jgi:putative membrane protein